MRHRTGAYPVVIGPGSRGELAPLLAAQLPDHRPVFIGDDTVTELVPAPLAAAERLSFPAGEAHKQRSTWASLTDQLLAHGCGRDTVLIALGGGVTTDLVGFVAATFLRGVPWVAMPSTTLAMVDASIGGKTGVDTDRGKNLVGAMHHPVAVVVDPDLLATLPERIFREGLAESAKHAVILDPSHGIWLREQASQIAARDGRTLTALIRRSIELKAGVVEDDESESGRRAILNAGHTVAHAIEQASHYRIPHGEAVAIGLVLETRYAESKGIASEGTAAAVAALLQALGLPTTVPPELPAHEVIEALQFDKKNRGGVVRATLLSAFGAVARDDERWTIALDLPILKGLLEERQAA